jgi:SAM-dependent methyltransferase
VADAIFSEPRLAEIYDALDCDRSDLDAYVALADEFDAGSVLDIGCGTGTLACLLAARGLRVVAVDPAKASLAVACRKPGAGGVRWLHASGTDLPALGVDLAIMTGNVAQVFVADEEWAETLAGVREALRPGGRLVFESRDPERKAWLEWHRDQTYRRVDVPGTGPVETWIDLTDADGSLVSFRTTFVFGSDGAVLTSDSTLRFRSREELTTSLAAAGLVTDEIRDAPDRPGREFVFIAQRTDEDRA